MTKAKGQGVLCGCAFQEEGFAIIPSSRVSSEDFARILDANGLGIRALGYGSARSVDSVGRSYRITGVCIVAVRKSEVRLFRTHARLCGIMVTPVRSA